MSEEVIKLELLLHNTMLMIIREKNNKRKKDMRKKYNFDDIEDDIGDFDFDFDYKKKKKLTNMV